jgi:hypothetical protein
MVYGVYGTAEAVPFVQRLDLHFSYPVSFARV